MIRIADESDTPELAAMLKEMYLEIFPDDAVDDKRVYYRAIIDHFRDDRDTVYLEDGKGFFIIRDETEPMAPTKRRYNGIRVYIRPEHRHSFLLAHFYKRLFSDFPKGDILGVTEINSKHIQVLDKRHTLIAKVYKLERR